MTGIFISYRRADSGTYAGRLFDRLSGHFGRDLVFMDIEGGIARGEDFGTRIEEAANSVAALVVVMGSAWVTCKDEGGGRRLDDPRDWVRQEITTALRRGILVLPVLVGGAVMPPEEMLPDEMRPITRRQAAEITDGRWDYDVGEIIKTLERVVTPAPDSAGAGRPSIAARRTALRVPKWQVLVASVLAAGVLGLIVWNAVFGAKPAEPAEPAEYTFTTYPPKVRLGLDSPEIDLRVTNTGNRPTPFEVSADFYSIRPSPGVLVIDADACNKSPVPIGASCTVKIKFDPKWLEDYEEERFDGELFISVGETRGSGIPLSIEPSKADVR